MKSNRYTSISLHVHRWSFVGQVVIIINFLLWLINLGNFGVCFVKCSLKFIFVEFWLLLGLIIVTFFLVVACQLLVEGGLSFSELLLVFLLAFGLGKSGVLTIVFNVLNCVASIHNILASNLEGQLNPVKQLAHNEGKVLNLLFVKFFNVCLEEANLLELLKVTVTASKGLVAAHSLEKLLIN